jgi:hypothetical protein
MTIASVVAMLSVLGLVLSPPGDPVADEPINLASLTEHFCLNADGDHAWTWSVAAHDGFTPLAPSEFEHLRLPGARQLRGFRKTIGGREVRVLTAVNRVIGPEQVGTTYFHLCWVAVDPGVRQDVDRDLRGLLHLPRFRQQDAFVYPWIPEGDEGRKAVSRRDFNRYSLKLSRERGMRLVLSNDYLGQVSVTYMAPVPSCEDWCY